LSQQPDLSAGHGSLYESCLDQLINSTDTVENMEKMKLLVRHLYRKGWVDLGSF
jgi:hypothetical protein